MELLTRQIKGLPAPVEDVGNFVNRSLKLDLD